MNWKENRNDSMTDLVAKLELLAEISCKDDPHRSRFDHIASEAARLIQTQFSEISALKDAIKYADDCLGNGEGVTLIYSICQ